MLDNVDQILEVARRHGLELEADALDDSGLDFAVLRARDRSGAPWILRSPRRPEVVDAARAEGHVLALVRDRLPVAVPDWRVHSGELIAYPLLAGAPALTMEAGAPVWKLDPAAPPAAFLDSFAQALAALLSIAPDQAAAAGVPVRPLAEVKERLAHAFEVARDALEPPEPIWARWQQWLSADELWPEHLALVHGDLHPGHMLLDDDARVIGILDWTEAQVTDPSIDLAMFLGGFGRGALEALIARLEAAGVRTWPRLADHAAERWAAFPAVAAEWAVRTGNQVALDFARAQLA
jgi:aminoglycoside phosphotransferase (APT) family kinase protein